MTPWGAPGESLPAGPRVDPHQPYDVVAVGASLANLFLLLRLSEHGCRTALLAPPIAPQSCCDLGVTWPGLTEHWGILYPNLGRQVEAMVRLFQESNALLGAHGAVKGGAVLQCASNPTEFQELAAELSWLNRLWPRRLMGAAPATNYFPLLKSEGAAFVPDCISLNPRQYREQLLGILAARGCAMVEMTLPFSLRESAGVTVEWGSGCALRSELAVVGASLASLELLGSPRPWLVPMSGTGFRFSRPQEPWNQSLVAVETQRGHLMLAPHPDGSWLALALAPAGGESDAGYLGWFVRELDEGFGLRNPDQSWSLRFCSTVDGLPLVGPLPGAQRTWLCAGLGSRSWSWGPALGSEMARVLLGEGSELLSELPALRPSRWLGRTGDRG